jgi:hypothetical protein
MKISESTNQLVEELSLFSSGKLRNIKDISFLVEASSVMGQQKLLDDIIFTAKYVNGLGKILRDHMTASLPKNGNASPDRIDENAMDKIRNEFRDHMKKISIQLTVLIKNIEENDRNEFEEKYLSMNQQSLVNLTTLIYDLSWLKKFKNRKVK